MLESLPYEFDRFYVQNCERNVCHVGMTGKGTVVILCGYKGDLMSSAPVMVPMCPECDRLLPLFAIREYLSHFEVVQTRTGKTHPMGDGVDSLFDAEDKPISPGTEGFREKWEKILNANHWETQEAYFPEPVAKKVRKATVKKTTKKTGE
jgi:hypothetical protein